MARPLRIEYPGAWYHVMNRVAGRRRVLGAPQVTALFLELMADLDSRFGVECHAYCLMGNHYHLLLHTPEGNLGRAMRHFNGVFTQRFNRWAHSDGPLFRGRYQAILVDADHYLVNLSRYIHRNPLEAGRVKPLDRYAASSYPAYVGKTAIPDWLKTQAVLGLMESEKPRDFFANVLIQLPVNFGAPASNVAGECANFQENFLEMEVRRGSEGLFDFYTLRASGSRETDAS